MPKRPRFPQKKAGLDNNVSAPDHYEGFWRKLRSIKFLAILGIVFSILIAIAMGANEFTPLIKSMIPPRGPNGKIIVKDENLATYLKADMDALFDIPFCCYMDSSGRERLSGELGNVITLASDEIFISVSAPLQKCSDFSYVLGRQHFLDDSVYYSLLPTVRYPFNNVPATSIYDDYLDTGTYVQAPCYFPSFTADEFGEEDPDTRKEDGPALEFLIKNNSDKGMIINYVSAVVHKSAINPFPIVEVLEGYGFDLHIVNMGIRKARNVRVVFNIQSVDSLIDYFAPFKYALTIDSIPPVQLGEVYGTELASLAPFFANEGVNTPFLLAKIEDNQRQHSDEITALEREVGMRFNEVELDLISPDNDNDTIGKGMTGYRLTINGEKEKKIFGRFKKGMARLVGKVVYYGINSNGKTVRDSIFFNCIQTLLPAGRGGDSYVKVEREYEIGLDCNNSNYTRNFKIAEHVKANDAVAVKLRFYSGKPAYHYFDLVFHYGDDKIFTVPNVFLHELNYSSALVNRVDGKYVPYRRRKAPEGRR